MKKLFAILATAAFAMVANTGCDVEADFSGVYNVYNISVAPGEWKTLSSTTGDGTARTEFYVDRGMAELSSGVVSGAAYIVYFKYSDGSTGVQEQLPVTVYENGYGYTLRAEISEGNLRLVWGTSDLLAPNRPSDTMVFRLAIIR